MAIIDLTPGSPFHRQSLLFFGEVKCRVKPILEIHGLCRGSEGDSNVHVCNNLFM